MSMMRLRAAILIVMGVASLAAAGEGQRFILTSAARNVHMEQFAVSSEDVLKGGKLPWFVQKVTLHGGKQEGVDVIVVNNGVLTIVLSPTRGMSVLDVRDSDTGERLLGWESPVKEVVHPRHINLESRGGLGWLDGFNEFMVRCGLEFAGHPGLDRVKTNTGGTADVDLTLHGRIGNVPASEVEVKVDELPPHRIHIRGVVHERMMAGPKLRLETSLSLVPGSASFRIEDTVTNQGAQTQEYQVIYHANYGAPILGKGAKLSVPARKIAPMNAHAATDIDSYQTYAGPVTGFVEQVYLIEPYARPEDGQTTAVLSNAAGDLAASVTWSVKQLPYLTIWKNTAAVEDGYVTGIEPGTGYPYNRSVERRDGRVPTLKPGGSQTFRVDFSVHRGAQSVKQAIDRAMDLQGDRTTAVKREPLN